MTRRTFIRKPKLPRAPVYKPVAQWLPVNLGFYGCFRQWLAESGYGPSALNMYGCAVRLVFSLLVEKSYWQIDPEVDLQTVREYILNHFDSAGTIESYFKGVAKFECYLRLRCHKPKPEKQVHWSLYIGALPDWMAEAAQAYVNYQCRRWPSDRRVQRTKDSLSQLTRSLRWLAFHTPVGSLTDITPASWFAYLDARLVEEIKPTTLNGELAALLGWLHFLQDQGQAVCQRLFLVEFLDEGDRLPKDIPVGQVRGLLQEIEAAAASAHQGYRRGGLMDRAWFLLMVHSGLRTGEIRRMQLGDIDWENRRVRIEQSKGLKDRLVPLSEAALTAVKDYLVVRGPVEALPEELFIFRHEALSISYCYARLESYGKSLGIKVNPHQLRHTAATLLLNAGAPILTVQAILGHKFVDTTLGYARLYDGTVAADYYKAMAQVERCLALPEDEAQPMLSHGELLALVETVRGEALSYEQARALQKLQAGIAALAERETTMQ